MLGTLSVYLLLLMDAGAAGASLRAVNGPLPQDTFDQTSLYEGTSQGFSGDSVGNYSEAISKNGSPNLPENFKEDLASYIASIQEWNQIIPQKFRDIPEAILGAQESFDFESMNAKLNSLEFGALNSHLAALRKSRRVRRYMTAQRRAQRRLLAQAKAKAKTHPLASKGPADKSNDKLKDEPQILAQGIPAQGLLEDAHSQLSLTYPDLFADKLDLSSAHPTAIESGKSRGKKTLPESGQRSYVEAFDGQTPLLDGSSEMISREPGETGWFLSSAYQHLPTLEWVGDSRRDLETPLISENTSRMLSTLASATLQRDAGLVFGKLAAGWRIDFSGRAEVSVYLDSNLRIVTSDDIGSDRYFVFLNAAPGGHLVYLNSAEGGGSGAVAFPVIGGTATYLDLTQISYTSFYGQVVLAGDEGKDGMGLSKATVRMLGQAAVAGVTNSRGYFHFDNVTVVSDYPVFVETDKGLGFTHRYRILPKNLPNLTLYRLSRNHINDWIGQIEGGISSDSGIVLAAVPGIVANSPDVTLVPSFRSIAPTLRMIPETYTLTPTDLLQPRTALEADENRFLGIEIPEGPVLSQVSQVSGDKKAVIWSELTIVSPNVVTLVGPY